MIKRYVGLLLVAGLLSLSAHAAEEVWIDVRTSLEHKMDRIDGDVRISHSDIVEEVTVLYPAKDTPIRLYCRSGGRSGSATEALQAAGYTDVKNAGGIDDARQQRGLSE